MKYYIIEHQKRADGEVNVSETSRSSFASGMSYWHERESKAYMNKDFPTISIMLVDENLNVIKNETVKTSYEPPVEIDAE